ncbi:MAG: hypothetical protein ACQEQM_04830 [Thermoplasmatota archaeon]
MGGRTAKIGMFLVLVLTMSLLVMPFVESQIGGNGPSRGPDIKVEDIEFSDDEPLEDDGITINVTVRNNESVLVQNLTLVYLVDNMEIDNVSGIDLKAGESSTYEVSWEAEPGVHNVSAVLKYNGEMLRESTANKELYVEPKPVGDVSSLLISLGVIVLAVVLIHLLYSVVKEMRF